MDDFTFWLSLYSIALSVVNIGWMVRKAHRERGDILVTELRTGVWES